MRKIKKYISVSVIIFILCSSFIPITTFAAPRCQLGDPILNIWFHSSPVASGTSGSVLAKIGNGDSDNCRDSEFRLTSNIPQSWHPTLSPAGDTFIPADGLMTANIYKQIIFTVPNNVPNQIFTFSITLKNKRTHRTTSQTVSVQVGNTPVITNMSPTSGRVGTHVTLSGQNFGPMPELAFQDIEHGFFYVRGVPSNGSTFSFDVPAMLSLYSCGCMGSSTPALYNVSIGNNGTYSNIMHFNLTP